MLKQCNILPIEIQKICQHTPSIYLCLHRLLNDPGLLIARIHHAPAHAQVTSSSSTTSSRVNISPKFSRTLQQTLNHRYA